MATYKLIQNIEAEDHILGPLSFRQFVFALIAVFLFYLCFLVVTKHVAFLLVLFLPPALFFLFFALPFGRDQPTEIWALAKLRFLFKSRKRVWDQSGVTELVTITVPKKIEHVYTDGLSQNEVKSRLSALAMTLDSRGWAVKNIASDSQPAMVLSSDRLVGLNVVPQEVSNLEMKDTDDILDTVSNPIAQQFDTMIDASTQAHRQSLIDELNGIRLGQGQAQAAPVASPPQAPVNNNWFMPQAGSTANPAAMQLMPQPVQTDPAGQAPTADEIALVSQLHAQEDAQHASYAHMRTMQPVQDTPADNQQTTDAQQMVQDAFGPTSATVTAPADPAILNLAKNNDLNISTLAREASKAKGDSPDEVVISLH